MEYIWWSNHLPQHQCSLDSPDSTIDAVICELSLFVVAFLDSMAAPEIFSLGLLWFSSLPKANRATLSVTALSLLMVNFILLISIISWCDVSDELGMYSWLLIYLLLTLTVRQMKRTLSLGFLLFTENLEASGFSCFWISTKFRK